MKYDSSSAVPIGYIYTTIRRREKYSAKAVSVNKFSRERPRVLARAYMGVEGSY